jgi:hypothetical protein
MKMRSLFNKFDQVILAVICSISSQTAFAETSFKEVKPLFIKYCIGCHGPKLDEADLRIDQLDPDMIKGNDGEMWHEAVDLINTSDMPPSDAKLRPTTEERELMVAWITNSLRKALEARRSTGGNVVMRRLTAYEYNNTLKDLLHLDLNYAKDLPLESVAQEGFANNNVVLGTSALHFETFKKIARGALEKIILIPDEKPETYRFKTELNFSLPDLNSKKNNKKNKNSNLRTVGGKYKNRAGLPANIHSKILNENFKGSTSRLPNATLYFGEIVEGQGVTLAGNRDIDSINDVFAADKKIGGAKGAGRTGYQPNLDIQMYEAPFEGNILVKVKAAAIEGKDGSLPNMSIEFGSFRGANYTQEKEFANVEVNASVDQPKVYEFLIQAENYPIYPNGITKATHLRIYNDFRRGTSKTSYEDLPRLYLDSVEVSFHPAEHWPPKATQELLFPSENSDDEIAYLKEILNRFMPRAFRRPVSEYEIEKKIAFYEAVREREGSFKSALVSTLTTILCSPHLLLIVEPQDSTEKRELNQYELASRLSYFLWSTMPDEELFELAGTGRLKEPEVLRSQVRRMISDSKSAHFVKNFTAQWLDTEGIQRVNVNPEYFTFDDTKKYHFEDETIAFVNRVFSENLSITNFIDSDFAVVNNFMARHYRIPDVSGSGFVKVSVKKQHHRGGLLTQASMLLANSTGAETHPIRRGVWVLERLLDDPPPPPPANVPELEDPAPDNLGKLSLKERLIEHAQIASCKGCHSRIDPWGVAFENYNALGQWREGTEDPLVNAKYSQINIDPTTTLKNGTEIENLEYLKKYILNQRKEHFVKAVIKKVMSYGIGRYVEFSDQKTVNAIYGQISEDNYRFQTLIENVIMTDTFLTK